MFFVDRSTNPQNLSALAARFVEIWFAQVRGVLLASRAFSAGFARRKGERYFKNAYVVTRIDLVVRIRWRPRVSGSLGWTHFFIALVDYVQKLWLSKVGCLQHRNTIFKVVRWARALWIRSGVLNGSKKVVGSYFSGKSSLKIHYFSRGWCALRWWSLN